jgi:hypothetical protein
MCAAPVERYNLNLSFMLICAIAASMAVVIVLQQYYAHS